jgi:hypothetical protein
MVPSIIRLIKTHGEGAVAGLINGISSGERDLARFFTDDADVLFHEAPMTARGFQEEMDKIFDSFPDFRYIVHDDTDGRPTQEQPDGTVVVQLHAVGNHTGAPYAYGADPEVPTTGRRVELPLECVPFVFQSCFILTFYFSIMF